MIDDPMVDVKIQVGGHIDFQYSGPRSGALIGIVSYFRYVGLLKEKEAEEINVVVRNSLFLEAKRDG